MVHHLCVLLVLLLGQQASSGPVPDDRSASFRDAHSCAHYYSWVKNEHYDTWELERKQCPDQLYFEPTLNVCKPADQLVIKCPKGSTIPNDEPSAVANSRRVRQLLTRDKKHADLWDSNDDLKYSTDEGKAMSPSNPEESGGKKLPFRRHPGLSAKQGTKRRKNTGNRANKKKKKNWVAIFVRGCNNRLDDSPFDDDDEQQDEQLEEDENENQTNDDVERPGGNQNEPHNGNQPNNGNGPNNGNEPHNNLNNNNELGDGSNENGSKPSGPTNENGLDERKKPSSNCTCNDSNQQSTTSKPDCNHHENLTASSTTPSSATPTTDPKLSGSTPENSPSVSTTSAPNEASPSASSNKPTNSPIRDNSTNAPRPSSSATPQSTTPHSTTLHSTTLHSTRAPVTSARPNPTPKPSTAKPKPSRIVLIPLKIANPHNSKNSTGKVDEKEALRLFLADLKRKRPGLSKESERQLALLFKAKVRGNDEKAKEPVDRTADHIEPTMVRAKNGKEPDVKDLKLEKIEEELGVELNDAFNYYTNLADKSKTNSTGGRA